MKHGIFISIVLSGLLTLAGCGPKLAPVAGTVTLDGKTVAKATVVFLSEDGKDTYSGTTDDSGNFTLGSGEAVGAKAGNYKVTVAKYPLVTGGDPNSKEAMESMKKEMDASKKGAGQGVKGGMPGMPMPGGVGGGYGATKSELPEIYATMEKTPLTAKVPSDGPVKLELKSKP